MVLLVVNNVKVLQTGDDIKITWLTVPEFVIEEKGITQERAKKLSDHAVYTFDPWDAKMAIDYAIENELDAYWLEDWRDGVADEWFRKYLYKRFYDGL